MARRFFRKLGALAKIETTEGTDAVPTGAANALLMSNVTVTPIQGDKVDRDNMVPYFGDQGSVIAGAYARIEGSIEMAGAGAAGDVPAYGAMLRACGMAEDVTVGTMVEYSPVSSTQESASLYFNMDGVNHVLLGARGTVVMNLTPKQIPKFSFTMSGLLGPIVDVNLPVVDLTDFQTPLVVSKKNTTFSLHGLAAVLESLSIDLANQVEARMLVNSESIEITDRKTAGTAVVEAVKIATKDWYSIALSSARGALSCIHGKTAGNIVEVSAPAVQIGQPTYGNSQGITTNSLPLMFCPTDGDDELVIRVR